MCLRTITKRIEKPSKRIKKVWKIFSKSAEGNLFFEYRSIQGFLQTGVWLKAEEKELLTEQNPIETYISGFHCYLNKKDAEEWFKINNNDYYSILLEVEVKEITVYGKQWASKMFDCVVAKQMFIPKQSE